MTTMSRFAQPQMKGIQVDIQKGPALYAAPMLVWSVVCLPLSATSYHSVSQTPRITHTNPTKLPANKASRPATTV